MTYFIQNNPRSILHPICILISWPSPPLEHFQEWSTPSLSVDVDGWMFSMNYDVTVAYGHPHSSHTGCLSVSRTTLIKETLGYNVVLKCATTHANKVSTHTSIICFEAKTVRLCLQIIMWMCITTSQRAKSSWKHRQPYQCGSSWISSICNSLQTKLRITFSRSKHDMLVTEILQVYRLTLFPFWFLAATTKPKKRNGCSQDQCHRFNPAATCQSNNKKWLANETQDRKTTQLNQKQI